MIDWFIRFNVLHMYSLVLHTKGGLISERSSLRSPKKMPNHSPEHYPPKGEYRRIWNMDRDLAPSFYSKWKLFEIKQPFSAFETKLSIFWTKWISSISCVNAKRCDVDGGGGGGGKGGGLMPLRGGWGGGGFHCALYSYMLHTTGLTRPQQPPSFSMPKTRTLE